MPHELRVPSHETLQYFRRNPNPVGPYVEHNYMMPTMSSEEFLRQVNEAMADTATPAPLPASMSTENMVQLYEERFPPSVEPAPSSENSQV